MSVAFEYDLMRPESRDIATESGKYPVAFR
jgi:hypothetical protein